MTEIIGSKVIVIEGTGGAGKTTTAQLLSQYYGLDNFNTGTLFRANAASMLYEGVHIGEAADFVQEANITVDKDMRGLSVAVNGREVSGVLQFPEVTRLSSRIGQIAAISAHLEHVFKQSMGRRDMVVEGKNLASRFAHLDVQMFFFDATFEVRAFRKWKQAQLSGRTDYPLAEALLDTRVNDTRDMSLLIAPTNTEIVDTTHLTPSEVARVVAQNAELE